MQDLFSQINWAIIAPFIIIQLILMVIAITDWVRSDQTNGPKWLWLIIICFVSILGPVLYFVIGRREN